MTVASSVDGMRMVQRWLVVFVAMALVAAACTGSDSTGSGLGDDDSSESTTTPTEELEPDSEETESEETEGEVVSTNTFEAPVVDDTPLELGDDIRTGVFDNGLTWYARSNNSPGSSVSMRLVIGAGGWHEDPVGTGIAHFLEHMMFNGTENYPGNTVDDVLRSIGAEIGPDFNAYTSTTETVYQIAVEDRGANVETAFDVLEQWASAATLDPAEVTAEAPIVREELRLRDQSGEGLVNNRFEEVYFDQTPFEGVLVGGTEDTILATTPESLRAFYDTWYRPDNMAVVAVGDRSLDELERLISDRFEGLEARGQTVSNVVPDFDLRTDPIVDVLVEPSYGDSFVSVDVPLPAWDLSTRGGNEQWVTEVLLGIMIDTRISEGVDAGRLDLRRGGGGWFPYSRGLQYFGFNVDASSLVTGTEVLMSEIQNTIENGFTQAELDRAIDIWANIQEQRLQQAGTTQDSDHANEIVEHHLGGGDLQNLDDSVEMHRDILDGLELDTVNNHYGWAMTQSAPLVLVVGPDEATVGEAADHLAALERASLAGGVLFEDDVVEISELMNPPKAVEEVKQNRLRENAGVELVFGNGMRVLIAESSISENQVSLVTESPGGRVGLSEDDGAIAPVAVAAVNRSGYTDVSAVQLRRYLSDLDVSLSAYVADYSEGFSGGGAAEDLETVFQLLHLAVTEPTVEDVPLEQELEFARDAITTTELDSSQAADVALSDALSGGGGLAAVPTEAQVDALDAETALSIYTDRFSALDDHVIVVVGDMDQDDVIDLARHYIGTLPSPDSDPDSAPLALPGVVDVRTQAGSGDTAGAYRLTSVGVADETVRNRVLADLANSVLNDRIFTVVREELGATYGGAAFVEFREPGDAAELTVAIDGDPARIDEIGETVDRELAAIASGTITAADFAEATTVVESRYNFINNGFIIQSLFDEANQVDGSRIITRNAQFGVLNSITAADITNFIDDLVSDTNRVDVRNIPN